MIHRKFSVLGENPCFWSEYPPSITSFVDNSTLSLNGTSVNADNRTAVEESSLKKHEISKSPLECSDPGLFVCFSDVIIPAMESEIDTV